MSERLFICIWPTGVGYHDRTIKKDGDWKLIAILLFSNLTLKVYDKESVLLPDIIKDAARLQAMKGQQHQVTGSGQTITLGFNLKK